MSEDGEAGGWFEENESEKLSPLETLELFFKLYIEILLRLLLKKAKQFYRLNKEIDSIFELPKSCSLMELFDNYFHLIHPKTLPFIKAEIFYKLKTEKLDIKNWCEFWECCTPWNSICVSTDWQNTVREHIACIENRISSKENQTCPNKDNLRKLLKFKYCENCNMCVKPARYGTDFDLVALALDYY